MSITTHATPLTTYLGQIDRTPLLSVDEEKRLAVRVLAGDGEARDHMVRANLRLVVSIARGYTNRGLLIDDLVAEGNMGLMRAVEGFDPTMNTRFSTYASYWIKQSIKRAIVNTAKTVRIPAYTTELLTKWRRTINKLTGELGRTPPHEEIAERLGLSRKTLVVIKLAIRVANAGSQSDQSGDGWSLEEMLVDRHAAVVGGKLGETDEVKQVLHFLERMDPREATVLRLRFGLNDQEPKTLKEIGMQLGLTRERIRQIERVALAKLYADTQSDTQMT